MMRPTRLARWTVIAGLLAMSSACVNVMGAQSYSGVSTWLPGWSKVTQAATPNTPDQIAKPAASFIVKFRSEPELDMVGKTFRRDAASARQVFAAWSEKHPGLEGLILMRASYSGELIVGLPKSDPLRRTPQDVLASFQAIDTLVYAERDDIAYPG